MYRSEGNYMSMDPETAMRGVRSDMTRQQLRSVAYSARCGAARRIALVRLNDPELTRAFALEDPDPMVRRGLVRRITDRAVLERISASDSDRSVREAADDTLSKLSE